MDKKEIKRLAVELANQYLNSYEIYKPIVEDACTNRVISEKELEWLFDHLLDVCEYDKNDELFFELCETYKSIYTDCVNDYTSIHEEILNEASIYGF